VTARTRSSTATPNTGKFLIAVDFWRQSLGLGHNAFARRLGISHTYWHHIRTGQRPVTLHFAQLILVDRPDLCDVLSEDLVRGKGSPPAAKST
jgi:hypothetical protein